MAESPAPLPPKWGPLAALAAPVLIVGPTLGSWKTPGVRAEPLFETLVAAQESWLSTAPLGTALVGLLGQVLDPVFALGMLVFLGLWLAGVGGFWLGRPGGAGPALVGMAALQVSPIVLRGLCTGEVGVLGVGFGALALATGPIGALFAAAAALWCWPVGLVALAGRWRCPKTIALVLPILALCWLAPARETPGALRRAAPELHPVSGYVTPEGAVLPLPAARSEGDAPSPRATLRGVYGGLAAALGLALGLGLGPRAPAAAGAALMALLWAGLGPLPSPEATGSAEAAWWAGLAPPGAGARGVPWGAAIALAGALGWVRAAERWKNGVYAGLFVIAASALLENPRLALPVANLPPDPGINALQSVEPGDLVVFPAPGAPWRQGARGPAEHRWYGLTHGRAEAAPELTAAVVGKLSAIANTTVDTEAARLIWENRARSLDEVRAAGAPYLLLDLRSVPPESRGPLEGWLAASIGPPLAEGDEYALYTFEMEGQDNNDNK